MSATQTPGHGPSRQRAPERMQPRPVSLRTVWTFFAATFALSWGLGALFVVFADPIEALLGPMGYTNPVFVVMVWAPGIVGVWMVLRHFGVRNLPRFLRRLTLWRMPVAWWAVLVLGMPAVFYAGALLTGDADELPLDHWYDVLPALVPAFLIGPVEELGWRGLALPVLQRRLAPLGAALVVGVVAALWHTPAFLLSGTKQAAWSFGPFFLGVVAISVILTAMFNAARGSLLVAVLFHAQMNGPAWPDAQPWDMVGFMVVALIVVLVTRRSMLTRGSGASAVLMPDDQPEADVPPSRTSAQPTTSSSAMSQPSSPRSR